MRGRTPKSQNLLPTVLAPTHPQNNKLVLLHKYGYFYKEDGGNKEILAHSLAKLSLHSLKTFKIRWLLSMSFNRPLFHSLSLYLLYLPNPQKRNSSQRIVKSTQYHWIFPGRLSWLTTLGPSQKSWEKIHFLAWRHSSPKLHQTPSNIKTAQLLRTSSDRHTPNLLHLYCSWTMWSTLLNFSQCSGNTENLMEKLHGRTLSTMSLNKNTEALTSTN